MTREDHHHEAIESALAELAAAERGGVFRNTPVDAAGLLKQSQRRPTGGRLSWPRWAAIAAVVALAVGVWSFMFSSQLRQLRNARNPAAVAQPGHRLAEAASISDAAFVSCFTGPGERVATSCVPCDYDADADVDLADFGRHQLLREDAVLVR